jgi:hypothetical protein
MQIRVKWSNLSFLTGAYQIRDVWQKKDFGTTGKDFIGDIPSMDVFLFELSLVKPAAP